MQRNIFYSPDARIYESNPDGRYNRWITLFLAVLSIRYDYARSLEGKVGSCNFLRDVTGTTAYKKRPTTCKLAVMWLLYYYTNDNAWHHWDDCTQFLAGEVLHEPTFPSNYLDDYEVSTDTDTTYPYRYRYGIASRIGIG